VEHTSTNTAQIAVGVAAGNPTFQATLSCIKTAKIVLSEGQNAQKRFDDSKRTFDSTLGVDRDTKLSVVNPVRFALLLRLEEERQPMKLKLMLEMTYRRRYRFGNKILSRRRFCYSSAGCFSNWFY